MSAGSIPVILVGQGGHGIGLSLASLASALNPTATGRGVSQPVGTCAEESAEGSHTGWYWNSAPVNAVGWALPV